MRIASYFLLFAFAVTAASAADDLPEYESENMATSVREAVLSASGETLSTVLRSDLDELQPVPSAEVAPLTALNGETTRVLGTVVSTYIPQGGSPVILNFGEDHRTCFKVVIYRRNHDHWGVGGTEIAALYEGAELLVEGTVSLYNDMPQIEVISPSQVRRVVDE